MHLTTKSYSNCVENCPICGGVGFLSAGVTDIHDPEFGTMRECPNRRRKFWDSELGISYDEAQGLDWNAFTQTDGVVRMRKAYEKLLLRGKGWLYVHGQPGNGKTIMGKAFAIVCRQQRGWKTRYIKMSDMVNWLRTSYDEQAGQQVYAARLRELAGVKVLVVDEAGRDRSTDFSKQSISDIIDKRYMDGNITVWLSNFKPALAFEAYQVDRITDAMHTVLELKEPSARRTERSEREAKQWWIEL